MPTNTATATDTLTATATQTATLTITPTTPQVATVTRNPFPHTDILDTFNRRIGGLRDNSHPWYGPEGLGGYSIRSNRVKAFGGGPIYWGSSSFGVNQEAYVTLTTVDRDAREQDLLLKVQGGSKPDWRKGAIEVLYDARHNAVRVETFKPGNSRWMIYENIPVTFNDSDQLGAQVFANGEVWIYMNGERIAVVALNNADQAFFNNKGGRIGLWFINADGAFFDDFGGGAFTP